LAEHTNEGVLVTDARFPYQDATLPTEHRVEDLLSRMTVEDKAALMFQPVLPLSDDFTTPGMMGSPSLRQLIDRGITHGNILEARGARELAQWHNAVQRAVQGRGLGIPFTISSDPRHSFSNNPMTALLAGPFSQWPEFLGFGALNDPELTRRYADTVRREYLAVGIRLALHPQVDLATDPRWARASGTFGSTAELVGPLAVAYAQGLQGETLGAQSVAVMAKHFPGGGAQLDGEDPHFDYGREQVWPGGMFDEHVQPFRDLIAAGVGQIMPYYGMPVGTEYEEVGFGFNKQLITGLLREQLGFDGIVCTDWAILMRTFWGVEDLSYEDRMLKAVEAGVDQFGGEFRPGVLVGLVRSGRVDESRIDVSARRLLAEKFRLGLFDDARFVDPDAAAAIVGAPQARAAGLDAQTAAQVLLKNDGPVALPLSGQPKVYAEGMSAASLAGWANVVATPQEADIAIVRTSAPWEKRGDVGSIDSFFHAGSLDFHDDKLAHLREVAASAPLVLDVYLDRPAILAPVLEIASAVTVNFGSSDEAFARILFGAAEPKGRLPFEIPASMDAVRRNLPDVPNDTENPTFRYRFGLGFGADWTPATRPDAASTTAPAVAHAGRYDLATTPFATLLDDRDARTILDELMPDLPNNPMIDMVKGVPFESVLALAADQIPAELADALRSRLAALPPR
jgi:beta-glucosidase